MYVTFPRDTLNTPSFRDVFLQDKGKSFKEKIAALTSICQTVQNALDMVASNGERVKK